MPQKQITLDCKAWVSVIVGALTIGGAVSTVLFRSYIWVDHQTTADLSHEDSIMVLKQITERMDKTNELGCASGKYKRWICERLGFKWRIMREDEADTATVPPGDRP